jgi:ribulose kinase
MNLFDMQRKFADVLSLESMLAFLEDFAGDQSPVAETASASRS